MDDIKTLASALRGVLSHANKRGDFFWRKADRMLDGFDALAEAHQAEVARLTRERDDLNDARNAAIERCNFMHGAMRDAQNFAAAAQGEAADLRHLLDIRPAMNAGLAEAYADWTARVYIAEIHRAALAGASGAAGEGAEQ